jgi:GTP-binding protein Era
MEGKTKHRSGFVNIIGKPNVGKSTLINQMIGVELSIATPKAQTTRHRILGIDNEEDHQIIYSDTPGIIDTAYKLQENMMQMVYTSLEDADILLLMIESGQEEAINESLRRKLSELNIPIYLLINKVDMTTQEELGKEIEKWQGEFPAATIMPVSALHGFNLAELRNSILEKLPEHPPYFPKDSYTNRSERFIVEQKIREKVLLHYKQEIPYAVEVLVEQFKEGEQLIRIEALIFVSRESQKIILIGKGGEKIKRLGKAARLDLEQFFGKKIYLELFVKVTKDWRDDDRALKQFGYQG